MQLIPPAASAMNTRTSPLTAAPNRMQRQLARLSGLPRALQAPARNWVLRRAVPFTGTAGIEFVTMQPERVEVRLRNHRAVQNHIRGVHASAMNLLAETATGMVVGLNVRDDCLPLAKAFEMAFRKRATGGLRAIATLSPDQRQAMQASDKGDVTVQVTVTDDADIEPVTCSFTWAWVPAQRNTPPETAQP